MTPAKPGPLAWIDRQLAELAELALLRQLRTHEGAQRVTLEAAGRTWINFGSNDYLALAADSRLIAAATAAIVRDGTGAGASPLVTGHGAAHAELESALAAFKRTGAALVFSSGYAANVGAITALAERGDALYSDEKNHASIIDGCRLSRADVHVYQHGSAGSLEAQLSQGSQYRRRLIVTESVFSMDGDLAPLAEIVELAERYDCMLLVDEAHATGVFGPGGRGLAETLGLEERIHVRVGTLSKALGAAGGFVCGSRALVDWLINRARPYVFSTALPPGTCAAALAALGIVETDPATGGRLLARAERLRQRLRCQGWQLGTSASQILPIVVGEAMRAEELSHELARGGLWVPAIRPPSVPPGESLLRISLTAGHNDAMIERLVEALAAAAGQLTSTGR